MNEEQASKKATQKSSVHGSNGRCGYEPPVLVEYGRLQDLTRGESGPLADFNSGTVNFGDV